MLYNFRNEVTAEECLGQQQASCHEEEQKGVCMLVHFINHYSTDSHTIRLICACLRDYNTFVFVVGGRCSVEEGWVRLFYFHHKLLLILIKFSSSSTEQPPFKRTPGPASTVSPSKTPTSSGTPPEESPTQPASIQCISTCCAVVQSQVSQRVCDKNADVYVIVSQPSESCTGGESPCPSSHQPTSLCHHLGVCYRARRRWVWTELSEVWGGAEGCATAASCYS